MRHGLFSQSGRDHFHVRSLAAIAIALRPWAHPDLSGGGKLDERQLGYCRERMIPDLARMHHQNEGQRGPVGRCRFVRYQRT
jgi:hypothetical protein